MKRSQIYRAGLTGQTDPLLVRLTVASEAHYLGYEYALWSGDVYRVVEPVGALPACLGERITAWVNVV